MKRNRQPCNLKNKAYGFICLILTLFLLSACTPQEPSTTQQQQSATETSITIPISAKDGLDIYSVTSNANNTALSLCYNGLFYLDRNYTIKPDLAESYSINGNTVSILISDAAIFSDGTSVTAEDCKFSFDQAKKSSVYQQNFSYIVSYTAKSSTEFEVVLSSQNPRNINLLCIPITKKGTEYNKQNNTFAVGAGKYYLKQAPSTTSNEDLICMYPNNYRNDMAGCKIKQIILKQYENTSNILYGINYGDLDAMMADLSDGSESYRGNIELQSFSNNALTFAVVNRNKKWSTNYLEVCKGLHYGIDRQNLYANVIKGCGKSCWSPLNPDWTEVINANLNDDIYDQQAAKTHFYNGRLYMSAENKLQWYGEDITLNIVVNRENSLRVKVANEIADQLQNYGFGTVVTQLPWEDYQKAIQDGSYDIYIAEVRIPLNMDLTGLLTAIGAPIGESLQTALTNFASGTADVLTLLEAFGQELPIIPLYYNNSALAINRQIDGTFTPSSTNPFNGIETWSFKS